MSECRSRSSTSSGYSNYSPSSQRDFPDLKFDSPAWSAMKQAIDDGIISIEELMALCVKCDYTLDKVLEEINKAKLAASASNCQTEQRENAERERRAAEAKRKRLVDEASDAAERARKKAEAHATAERERLAAEVKAEHERQETEARKAAQLARDAVESQSRGHRDVSGRPSQRVLTKCWYYSLDGKTGHGPITSAELKELIHIGRLKANGKVSRDGKTWHSASQLQGANWPA